jgi:tetratricopeptide (TPR) repeat protein
MPRCPHCAHELAASDGLECPACHRDLRESRAPEPASAAARPAHLAVLEAGEVQESTEARDRRAPSRFVSTAGPSVPIIKQQNDSVPSGWMARLEAAKNAASAVSGPPAVAPPRADSVPPPLPAAPRPPPRPKSLEGKPAHLLIAHLEAENSRRHTSAVRAAPEAPPVDAIARVEVARPALPRARKVPDWVIFSLLGALVLGGIGFAYTSAHQAPAPRAEIDPALAAAAEKRKAARAALDEGHQKLLAGADGVEAAIVAYQRALALEPNLASAERGLAIAFAARKDEATAVQHYQRYLQLDPDAKDADEVRAIIARYHKASASKHR